MFGEERQCRRGPEFFPFGKYQEADVLVKNTNTGDCISLR